MTKTMETEARDMEAVANAVADALTSINATERTPATIPALRVALKGYMTVDDALATTAGMVDLLNSVNGKVVQTPTRAHVINFNHAAMYAYVATRRLEPLNVDADMADVHKVFGAIDAEGFAPNGVDIPTVFKAVDLGLTYREFVDMLQALNGKPFTWYDDIQYFVDFSFSSGTVKLLRHYGGTARGAAPVTKRATRNATKAEFDLLRDTKLAAMGGTEVAMPGRIGYGSKLHRLYCSVIETKAGTIVLSASSGCGSQRWTPRGGRSFLQVFGTDPDHKVTCTKCKPEIITLTNLQLKVGRKHTTGTAYCPACDKRVKVGRAVQYRYTTDENGNKVIERDEAGNWVYDELSYWQHSCGGHIGNVDHDDVAQDPTTITPTHEMVLDAFDHPGQRRTVASIADAIVFKAAGETVDAPTSTPAQRRAVKQIVNGLLVTGDLDEGPKVPTQNGGYAKTYKIGPYAETVDAPTSPSVARLPKTTDLTPSKCNATPSVVATTPNVVGATPSAGALAAAEDIMRQQIDGGWQLSEAEMAAIIDRHMPKP